MNIIELCLLLPQFGHTVVVLQCHLQEVSQHAENEIDLVVAMV